MKIFTRLLFLAWSANAFLPRARPRLVVAMAATPASSVSIKADAEAVGAAVLAKVDIAAARAIAERGATSSLDLGLPCLVSKS